ncbi:glycosyltransferase family 2 protein [Dubosiella newyorkensis]|uniref:glycosyltransferase family 2 protein n=1 Tax=Dubosiella newyorkensis TaxID=1862672 RepID=UPI003F67CE6C
MSFLFEGVHGLSKQTSSSILVPVYNVEKYIATCLDSLLAQAIQNRNCVIDDGSPDRCDRICQKYAKKFPNIPRIIFYENAGISTNKKSIHSICEWRLLWMFVDSDDYIHPKNGRTMIRISQLINQSSYNVDIGWDYFKYFPFLRKVANRQTIDTIQAPTSNCKQ